jgi:hypothetical protein
VERAGASDMIPDNHSFYTIERSFASLMEMAPKRVSFRLEIALLLPE